MTDRTTAPPAAPPEADFFKSLADPVRLQVVARLACTPRPMTVTEVRECCGVHLSGVSRHLATLRAAGIVAAKKEGREVRYRLRADALADRLRGMAAWLEASVAARRSGCGSTNDDATQEDERERTR